MQFHKSIFALAVLAAPAAHASTGTCSYGNTSTPCQTLNDPPPIATPANMGQYCSTLWDDGTWGFTSFTNLTTDPCGNVGSTHIQRAGLYSTTGINNVLEKCAGKIGRYRGIGNAPLTEAFDDADDYDRMNCVFTVSPDEFPIFNSPFKWGTDIGYSHFQGFDFARAPYNTIPLADGTSSTMIDSLGRPRDGQGFNEDHGAHDYVMDEHTQLFAAADGVVDRVRARKVDMTPGNCDFDSAGHFNGDQVEIYIRHRISGGGGTTRYDEYYETIYDHLSSASVQAGDIVHRGDAIGFSGHTGCTSGVPHLHFAVLRMTNTSSFRSFPYVITPITTANAGSGSDNGGSNNIEPDGYAGSATSIDPWAWRPLLSGSTDGAFSPKMWRANQQPPLTPTWNGRPVW